MSKRKELEGISVSTPSKKIATSAEVRNKSGGEGSVNNSEIYLECTEGIHNKFYRIQVQDSSVICHYGPISGKPGVRLEKAYGNAAEAQAAAFKAAAEKKKKGYIETRDDDALVTSKTEAKNDKAIDSSAKEKVQGFVPCTYAVSIYGYGGEYVMGKVDRKVWNYCIKNNVDLSDVAFDCIDFNYDEDLLPFPPGCWHDCDNMAHENGATKGGGAFTITDENGKIVLEDVDFCDPDGNFTPGPEFHGGDVVNLANCKPDEVVFIGNAFEKGVFFDGEIHLKSPFDIKKLKFGYENVYGREIITSVEYDGEEIDSCDYSTNGKGSEFDMILIKAGGKMEHYSRQLGLQTESKSAAPAKTSEHGCVYGDDDADDDGDDDEESGALSPVASSKIPTKVTEVGYCIVS